MKSVLVSKIIRVLKILFVLEAVNLNEAETTNVLFTNKIVGFIAKGFKFGHLIAAHPLEWDDTSGRPRLSQCSKQRKYCFYVTTCVAMLCYPFQILQFLRFQLIQGATPYDKMLTTLGIWLCAVSPCNQIMFLWKGNQIPGFVCAAMDLMEDYESKYLVRHAKSPKIIHMCFLLMLWMFYGLWAAGFVSVLYFLTNPHSPVLLSSVLLRKSKCDGWGWDCVLKRDAKDVFILTVSHLLEVYILIVWLSTCFLIILTVVPFVFIASVAISELSTKGSQITKDVLRSWDCKTRVYSQMSILTEMALDIYGFSASYAKALISSFVVFSAYVMLKYEGVLSIGAGLIAVFPGSFLFSLFYALAKLYLCTCALLEEWKLEIGVTNQRERKLRSRQLASIRPLKVHLFSGSYFVDKAMLLTMGQTLLESLVSTLMVYP